MDDPRSAGGWGSTSARLAILAALVVTIPFAVPANIRGAEETPLDGADRGTFTFSGTLDGVAVAAELAAIPRDRTTWRIHPGAIDIDSSAASGLTFAAIDRCAAGGGIDLVGRDLPASFEVTATDTRTGASRTYRQVEGMPRVGFVHPDAIPCPAELSVTAGDRLVVDIIGERAAGDRRGCDSTVSFGARFRGSGRAARLERRFAGGPGGDRLERIGGDRLTGTTVFHARGQRYSAVVILRRMDRPDGRSSLTGWLLEGRRGSFDPRAGRVLLQRLLASPRDPQGVIADEARGRPICGWRLTSTRPLAPAGDAYWTALEPRPGGPVVEPTIAALSRRSDQGGRFRWRSLSTIASAPIPAQPIVADEDGVFWVASSPSSVPAYAVLDGCAWNGHFWFYAAAATELEADLRVTDTATRATMTYRATTEPAMRSFLDTESHACVAA